MASGCDILCKACGWASLHQALQAPDTVPVHRPSLLACSLFNPFGPEAIWAKSFRDDSSGILNLVSVMFYLFLVGVTVFVAMSLDIESTSTSHSSAALPLNHSVLLNELWWLMPIIPALWKLRQENCDEFEEPGRASLGYSVRSCLQQRWGCFSSLFLPQLLC